MYNRYVPQNDGSYSRRQVPDQAPPQPKPAPPEPEKPCPPPPPPPQTQNCTSRQEMGIGGFLRKILPAGFDTGDLMIVLLLLLMAGDCQEDQNWAILTLVLYLFL